MDRNGRKCAPIYSAKYSSKAYDVADNVVAIDDDSSSVTSMPALETPYQNSVSATKEQARIK